MKAKFITIILTIILIFLPLSVQLTISKSNISEFVKKVSKWPNTKLVSPNPSVKIHNDMILFFLVKENPDLNDEPDFVILSGFVLNNTMVIMDVCFLDSKNMYVNFKYNESINEYEEDNSEPPETVKKLTDFLKKLRKAKNSTKT